MTPATWETSCFLFVETRRRNDSRKETIMNRNQIKILLTFAIILLASVAMAQDDSECIPGEGPGQGNGVCQFIDEDGDGFNDLAPDADGDGIPNGLDDDFVRPEDGSGLGSGSGAMNQLRQMFGKLDEVLGQFALKTGVENGHMFGVGDCTGIGDGPADGTGFGPGSADGGNGQGSAGEMAGGGGGFGGNGSGNGHGRQ